MKNIQERLDSLINQIDHSVDVNDLNQSTDLCVDYNFDSISIITLVVRIEEEFKIEFPNEYLIFEELRYYSKLLHNVNTLVEKKANIKD